MDTAKHGVMAALGVGLAAVSAWMHIRGQDGSGWGFIALITWLMVILSD